MRTVALADSVRDALQRLHGDDDRPDGTFTRAEYQRATGLCETTARQHLRDLSNAGRLELAGRVQTESMDGRRFRVPLYRLVEDA